MACPNSVEHLDRFHHAFLASDEHHVRPFPKCNCGHDLSRNSRFNTAQIESALILLSQYFTVVRNRSPCFGAKPNVIANSQARQRNPSISLPQSAHVIRVGDTRQTPVPPRTLAKDRRSSRLRSRP